MANSKGKRTYVWIIVGLIFLGLIGFGGSGLSGNIRNIGTVGDKELTVAAYQSAVNEQIRTLEAQFGTLINFQQAREFGLDQVALNQLILVRSLDNEADQMAISVGDARIRDVVVNNQNFFGGSGSFNRETYRFALEQAGLSEAAYEASIREQMSRDLLQGSVVGGVPAATDYANALVQYVGERRDITWATIDQTALTAPVPGATQADLVAYYEANPDAFTLPETREITYAWLTPDMIQDDLEVDETALRQLYDDRIAEFVQPERRLVERLIYLDTEKANDAKARLDAGEIDFDGLVAERGLDLADIDLGDVGRSELGDAGDVVFAANPGDVVGPVNLSLGPALFRMNAVLSAQETTFEEAMPDLREELAASRARRVIDDGREGITDLTAGGARIEDIVDRTDMVSGTISWTPDTATSIAAYEEFRVAAATVQQGDFAEVFDLDDGGIFMLHLDGITPPTLQPLDDVRDAVRAGWLAQTTQAAVIAKADDLAAQIQPLTGFATLGLAPNEEIGLTRRSFVEGTPPGFLIEVFDMAVGEVKVIDNATSAIILRLEDIAAPDPADPQTISQQEALAENAASGIAQDIFDAYATSVQLRTDVNINQAVLNSLNAQLQ